MSDPASGLPEGRIFAGYFDGTTAARHAVLIQPAQDGLALVIERADGAAGPVRWPFDRLRALTDQSGGHDLTLTLSGQSEDGAPRDLARLVVSDSQAIAWFRRTRPSLFQRDLPRGVFRRVALWLVAAAAAVVLMLFVILPRLADVLASHLPAATEARFGRAIIAEISDFLGTGGKDSLECKGKAGLAALEKLKTRLTARENIGYEINLVVLDHEMVNAFAIPGGNIVILRGLLTKAHGPDDVAGVLAHELGHVAHRDPTRLMLRAAGSAGILSLVLGDITGGAILTLAGDQLLQATYSREAEAAADDFAFGLMNRSGISSVPFADFFERMAEETDIMPEFMASHPRSANRAKHARANAGYARGAGLSFSPALNDADWLALKSICQSPG